MRLRFLLLLALTATLAAYLAVAKVSTANVRALPPPPRETFQSFAGPKITVDHPDPHIRYDLDPAQEKFLIHLPANYSPNDHWGAIIFISAADTMTLPTDWAPILARRKLLFIAPQNAGNDQEVARRFGLAVLAALKSIPQFHLDPHRIFAAGFSGGARIAGSLPFYHPELFPGTIQSCGANFPGPVPILQGKIENPPYGQMTATPAQIQSAKHSVRFVLITGPADFRHGNILDLYQGGFKKTGFQTLLLDIPSLSHQLAPADTLQKALDFLENP